MELVQSTTLDEYWLRHSSFGVRPVDMIIIDVEGAESQVLRGARALLSASPGVVLMAECTKDLEEIDLFLRDLGFSFHLWDAAAASLVPTEIARGNMIITRGISQRPS